MFDIKAPIVVPMLSPDAPKVEVRYPTDSEWIEYKRKKKVVQKDLGRGNFNIEPVAPSPADLALLQAIRLDKDGPALDEAEATYILNRLSECDVVDRPDREGSSYVIRLKIMRKLMTEHVLQIPSVKAMMDYERKRSTVIFGKYGSQEIKINYQASADLYDALKVSAKGYKGDVPVVHKAEAVNVLLQELRGEQEEIIDDDDEDRD